MTGPMIISGILARDAEEAAKTLANLCEWEPAGLMLRVMLIALDGDKAKIALPYALNARASCGGDAGREACTAIIQIIDGAA